jgi:hypothetical protein
METSGKETTWKTQAQMGGDFKMDLQEVGWGSWIRLFWLRIRTGGGHL